MSLSRGRTPEGGASVRDGRAEDSATGAGERKASWEMCFVLALRKSEEKLLKCGVCCVCVC